MIARIYNLLGRPLPNYARYPLGLLLWKPIRKFLNVVVVPNVPFSKLRVMLYRAIGYSIAKDVFIGMKCYLDDMDPKLTVIGEGVTISYAVKCSVHGKGQNHTSLVIEKGAYVGMGALLVSGKRGIRIGRNAVIGAGSVVVNDVPQGATVVGVPAKVIRL